MSKYTVIALYQHLILLSDCIVFHYLMLIYLAHSVARDLEGSKTLNARILRSTWS
jgi:hypothetical protein